MKIFVNCRISVLTLGLVLTFMLLSSCAKNKIVSSWSAPEMKTADIKTILVIGVAHNATYRRLFENAFVQDLKREGTAAIPSYNLKILEGMPTPETVIQVVKETGADAVLLTRMNSRSEKTYTREAVGRTDMALDRAPYEPVFMLPDQTTTTSITIRVVLESKLYETASKNLIWSATSELKDPVMTKKYVEKATVLLVEDLKKANIL